jgi:glucose dehydrogenase
VHHFQRSWRETIRLIRDVTEVPALVDSTGVGDPVLEELQAGSKWFEGFKFSSQSKQQIMEGLAVAIQREEIAFPDGPIRHELELFEYEYTRTGVRYSAPDGFHDDLVCALALAWHYRNGSRDAARFLFRVG